MSFILFFGLLVALFFISIVGYRLVFLRAARRLAQGTQTQKCLFLGSVGIWPLLLWAGALFLPVFAFQTPVFDVVRVMICAVAWSFVRLFVTDRQPKIALLFLFAFCASYGLPVATDSWLEAYCPVCRATFMALMWTLFVGMFLWFDHIKGFNVNVTAGLMLAALVMSMAFHAVAPWVGAAAVFLWVLSVPLNAFVGGMPTARYPFAVIGFMWGFLLVTLMMNGMTGLGITACGYYLFEILIAFVTAVYAAKKLDVVPNRFLTEQVVEKYPNDLKLNRFVMIRSLLFAAIGIVFTVTSVQLNVTVYAVCLGIVCLDLYKRLRDWGQPKVRLRDLFSDMKQGVSALAREAVQVPLKQAKEMPSKTKSVEKGVQKTKKHQNKTVSKSVKKPVSSPKKDVKSTAPKTVSVKKTGTLKKKGKKTTSVRGKRA